jgi:7-cyano-7-deazaguanine synthase
VEKAVALVSGGLKSGVMVAAERDRCELLALHIRTGGRASPAEQAAFTHLCEKWGIAQPTVVSMPHLAELIDSPWFDSSAAAIDLQADADAWDCSVPGLMPSLLDVAVLHAIRVGARRILVGACEFPTAAPRLGPLQPDHRREFYQVYNEMLSTAIPAAPPAVYTPLIDLSLADIVKLGQRLRVPLDATWSCLLASQKPCGKCAGCRHRAIGFLQAGIADPAAAPARGQYQ